MKSSQPVAQNIDEYIAGFPNDVRDKLEKIRTIIKKAAPRAEEKISYQIPAFALHEKLVHFGAYKKHIGFYPTSSAVETFKNELAAYECTRGAVQFPLDKPLPLGLISRIVKFRVKESVRKAETKGKKK